jgi:redox-sensitive bicupin YhaK (pirin superfamily)
MSNLERAPTAAVSTGERPVRHPEPELLDAREVDLGEGMPVRRLLPKRGHTTVGPWCFVDHFGPLDAARGDGLRVPPHPHTGLQTVTWLLEGTVLHRDSLGSEQLIRPGQLNLMTAGRGIAHSEESPTQRPPVLHGVQLWTALPGGWDTIEPAFEHLPELPVAATAAGGLRLTVLMGELLGAASPATAYSPVVGADVAVDAATDDDLPLRPDFEHALLALSGRAVVDGATIQPGRMAYLAPGREHVAVRTGGPARLLLLGGEPFGEPIIMWWNFVTHSHEELVRAHADWQASSERFGQVRGYPYGPRLEVPPLPPGRLRPR